MIERARQQGHQGRGVAFLLWGWAMLLVVALSAAPTGGEVRTRPVGSAFDPATLSVALTPKSAKAKAATRAADDDALTDSSAPPPDLQGILVRSAPQLYLAVAAAPVTLPPPFAAAPGRASRAHGARAPPLA